MDFWIDNTSLHAVGRALQKSASSDTDIENLLQFSTHLIFADRLVFSGFEGTSIRENSEKFMEMLRAEGVNDGILLRDDLSPKIYESAAREAAREVSKSLILNRYSGHELYIPDGAKHDHDEITEVVQSNDQNFLTENVELVRQQRASGVIKYMILVDENLRNRLREYITSGGVWNPDVSFGMSVHLRSMLNVEISRKLDSAYHPSISRADFIWKNQPPAMDSKSLAIPKINKTLLEQESALHSPTLDLPPIDQALLWSSGGLVQTLIENSLRLREEAKPIRDLLHDAYPKGTSPSEAQLSLQNQINDAISYALKMKSRPKLSEKLRPFGSGLGAIAGFGFATNMGASFPMLAGLGVAGAAVGAASAIPQKEIREWYQQRMLSKKFAVITRLGERFRNAKLSRAHWDALKQDSLP